MRTILFRGFQPDENGTKTITLNGEKIKGDWVYGDLLTKGVDYAYAIRVYDDENYGQIVKVIAETIGQYTGLTDKNGNVLFEGDIMSGLFSFGAPINGIIKFQDGAFGVIRHQCGADRFNAFTSFCNVKWGLAGNKFENPDLLEVEE